MKCCLIALALIPFPSWTLAQLSRVPEIPETSVVYTLSVVRDTLYAATDSLVYVRANAGTSWFTLVLPAASPDFVTCLVKYRGALIAGTFRSGIFRSTDEGSSWKSFNSGLEGLGATSISNLLVRRDSLIAGTYGAGVFTTNVDLSHPWSAWSDSIADYQGDNVFKMLVVGNTVLAGAGANGYMFRYTDAQPWWNPVPLNTPRHVGHTVSGMATDVNAVVAGTNLGIYRSTNEGLSWEIASSFIPQQLIQILILFHETTFYALETTPLASALLASSDEGKTWQQLGVYPLPNVLDITIVGDTLFLGNTGGLWKASLSQLTTSVTEKTMTPGAFRLQQNYPNPFNPSTTISYELPRASYVTLAVFNSLGQRVSTLVGAFEEPGYKSVQFDGSRLSSGVYFYRLSVSPLERRATGEPDGQAGAFVLTKKLMLLK